MEQDAKYFVVGVLTGIIGMALTFPGIWSMIR